MVAKIQNYIVMLMLVSCTNSKDNGSYSEWLDKPTENMAVKEETNASDAEAIIVPTEFIEKASNDDNAEDILFIDIKIKQQWKPDSSMSNDKVKQYLAFEMIDNIRLMGIDTIKPLFGHFEDLFGIRNYNILHVAFPRSMDAEKFYILEHDNELWQNDRLRFQFNKEALLKS
jgi:hypothetical protein